MVTQGKGGQEGRLKGRRTREMCHEKSWPSGDGGGWGGAGREDRKLSGTGVSCEAENGWLRT